VTASRVGDHPVAEAGLPEGRAAEDLERWTWRPDLEVEGGAGPGDLL
jgi:hypothetical protein